MISAMPPIDEETLARTILTTCVTSPDLRMTVLLQGADSASHVVDMLIERTQHDAGTCPANRALDSAFALGLTRLGKRVTAERMQSFHDALATWLQRLSLLPTFNRDDLATTMTDAGNMTVIAPHSPYWPQSLADIPLSTEYAAPLCLWVSGDPEALISCERPLAIVGSRSADEYGLTVARELGRQAAAAGHLVVSGGAMGIDAAAHWGSLAAATTPPDDDAIAPGRTVAIFAGGLHHIGPRRNQRLFERIVRQGGALISELCPEAIPEAHRFLMRNRLIAAMASTIVVAQARRRSGALNTANHAYDMKRLLYAVPGPITAPHHTGCNILIRDQQAIILTTLHCMDELMMNHPPHHRISSPVQGADMADQSAHHPIIDAIRHVRNRGQAVTTDALLAYLRRPEPSLEVNRLLADLAALELDGRIARSGNIYTIIE